MARKGADPYNNPVYSPGSVSKFTAHVSLNKQGLKLSLPFRAQALEFGEICHSWDYTIKYVNV